jgi:hypothetical protein
MHSRKCRRVGRRDQVGIRDPVGIRDQVGTSVNAPSTSPVRPEDDLSRDKSTTYPRPTGTPG